MSKEPYFDQKLAREPTVQEWLEYAAQARLNQRVIDYITDHPEQLVPSRRSWNGVAAMLDNAEKDGALDDKFKRKRVLLAIAGLVGDSNAANFSEYLTTIAKEGI